MQGIIEVEGDDRTAAARRLLGAILESEQVDGLLVALRHPAGDAVTPALVKEPALLALADPFAPVMPVSAARLVSMLTQKTPRPRLAVVLRNCELRALIELVKLQQASLNGVTLIGVECTGTYEVADYARIALGADRAGFSLRPACQMCEYPVPALADITLQQIGLDGEAGLRVEIKDGSAWRDYLLVEGGGLLRDCWREIPPGAVRAAAVEVLIAGHTAERDRVLAGVARHTSTPDGLSAWFSTCIRCHNCMTNCPICYCKTCFFKTDVFDHEPMHFITWAQRKGATRLPPDTTLFHLTRMNHMATSCVGCGLCTSACPAGIQVGAAFRAVAARTQAAFGYQAGRSLDEVPPVKTFQVDELHELGEK
jgi:formate dehydrogenase (coenzyme F420) beta subunit